MNTPKALYIRDINENQQVDSLFLVREVRLAETKAGKPFLTLVLMDKTGEITGRIWDNAQRYKDICLPGVVIQVQAQSQLYKSVMQLNVNTAQAVNPSSYELSDYLPASPHDIGAMEKEMLQLIDSIEDKEIKRLLLSFVNDKDLWQLFLSAPAAKLMHHAYIGGLLEHTLGLLKLADSVALQYGAINRSLLFAGVFLHDYGKVKEFSFDVPPFNYSDYGRLVGHMVITIELLQEKINQLSNFSEQKAMMIKHLVLSHHGRHEFGSPVVPMTREAFVLHLIDDLDAKMNYMDKLSPAHTENEYEWTDYQRTLERFLYVRGSSGLSEEVISPANEQKKEMIDDSKQPSLWEQE